MLKLAHQDQWLLRADISDALGLRRSCRQRSTHQIQASTTVIHTDTPSDRASSLQMSLKRHGYREDGMQELAGMLKLCCCLRTALRFCNVVSIHRQSTARNDPRDNDRSADFTDRYTFGSRKGVDSLKRLRKPHSCKCTKLPTKHFNYSYYLNCKIRMKQSSD